MKRTTIYTIVTALLMLTTVMQSKAQLNHFQTIYFQNPYLYNPAMAGIDPELKINTNYRQQGGGIPGAPKTTSLTADYQPTSRVGIGLNLSDEQAGLIRQTRIMGSYAYHLPVGENQQQLHFGLSLGLDNARVDFSKIRGDITDTEVAQFNQLKPYVDGDFGAAYTDNNLYIGAAIPNLKSSFFKASDNRFDADRMLFIGIASYKIYMQSESRSFVLQPLVGFRSVKGYDNIIDGGFNFTMNNYGIYMQAIYHSSQSLGLGFGLDQKVFAINLGYNMETGPINTNSQGAFELGLQLRLFGKNN
jgi:type IX secretion system PorP/SprF family membrane protein